MVAEKIREKKKGTQNVESYVEFWSVELIQKKNLKIIIKKKSLKEKMNRWLRICDRKCCWSWDCRFPWPPLGSPSSSSKLCLVAEKKPLKLTKTKRRFVSLFLSWPKHIVPELHVVSLFFLFLIWGPIGLLTYLNEPYQFLKLKFQDWFILFQI